MGSWPDAKVFRYDGDNNWLDVGQPGAEKEAMAAAVYNGQYYVGTLPLAAGVPLRRTRQLVPDRTTRRHSRCLVPPRLDHGGLPRQTVLRHAPLGTGAVAARSRHQRHPRPRACRTAGSTWRWSRGATSSRSTWEASRRRHRPSSRPQTTISQSNAPCRSGSGGTILQRQPERRQALRPRPDRGRSRRARGEALRRVAPTLRYSANSTPEG